MASNSKYRSLLYKFQSLSSKIYGFCVTCFHHLLHDLLKKNNIFTLLSREIYVNYRRVGDL